MTKIRKQSGGERSARLSLRVCKAARHSGATYKAGDGRAVPAREVVWDSEIRGLGLRLYPGGRRSWVLRFQYRGRTRTQTIGDFPGLLPDGPPERPGARQVAQAALGRLAQGLDPFPARADGKTFADLETDVLENLREGQKGKPIRASTLAKYRETYRLVVEELGGQLVDELTEAAARAAYSAWKRSRGPVAANHGLRILREALRVAAEKGLRDRRAENPTCAMKYSIPSTRGRELEDWEYQALGEALALEEALHPDRADCVAAIRLLALTGCRRREITGLKWEEVDLAKLKLNLKETKTGRREVALSTAAAELLAALRSKAPRDARRVFPATEHEVGYAIQHTWKRVRKIAKLPADTRLHDLRHSYVTTGLAANFSEALVGRAVGHRSTATTRRYSHLKLDPARQVADRVGAEVAAKLAGKPKAETTNIQTGEHK